MFPQVERAVLAILADGKVVAPVEVLVRMGTLRGEDLVAWRLGRIPFLEQVIQGNLSRLRRFLRILGFLCHDLNLTANETAYVRRGEGGSRPLRFTKTGEPRLERIYVRHFVWPGKGPFHLPRGRNSDQMLTPRPREASSGRPGRGMHFEDPASRGGCDPDIRTLSTAEFGEIAHVAATIRGP